MSNASSESSTSKTLAIVTAIVAVVGLVVSAWSTWYATSSARADSIRHDRDVAAAERCWEYLERCDALVGAVRIAILTAEGGRGVDEPTTRVRTNATSVASLLDPDGAKQLNELVEALFLPVDTAPLQLLNDEKDDTKRRVHRQNADNLAKKIEALLAQKQGTACPPN